MSTRDPLSSLFFRHRRRKQLSADGHIPGLEYQARIPGSTHAPPTGYAAQVHRGAEYVEHQRAEYDPGHGFYRTEGPDYEQPQSWHESHIAPTPPFRMPLPPIDQVPGPPQYRDSLLTPEMFFAAMEDALRSALAEFAPVPFEDGRVISASDLLVEPNPSGFAVDAEPHDSEEFGHDVASQHVLPEPASLESAFDAETDATALTAPGMDSGGETLFDDHAAPHQTLEDLVEQEWQQLDPFTMQDPMDLDPYSQFPPGMPMDPFGGMGM